jgi:hypothetical protein
MMLSKLRIALVAILLALAAVSAIDSASAGWGDIDSDFDGLSDPFETAIGELP